NPLIASHDASQLSLVSHARPHPHSGSQCHRYRPPLSLPHHRTHNHTLILSPPFTASSPSPPHASPISSPVTTTTTSAVSAPHPPLFPLSFMLDHDEKKSETHMDIEQTRTQQQHTTATSDINTSTNTSTDTT